MSNNHLIVTNVDDPDAINDAIIRFQTQGKPHPEAQRIWRWRYVNGIAGRAIISLVWDGEKIVGHHALALVDFVAGSKKFKIGMGGGTMVDEDYRGRGIYRMLRNREYEMAISRNVPMLFGFPNNRVLPLALKTGSRIHHIPEIVYKPLSLTKNLPLRDPWGLIVNIGRYISSRDQARKEGGSQKARNKGITVKEITSFGDETKILWEKLIRSEYVGIQKDVSYLHWRYVLRPNTCFRAFVGFIDDKPSSLCVIEWDQSE
ncbi:MAG: GNAT family N-acetyltransferase, partial [Deltaproteobacteria bacterium]|nr:GNAT family N-acetyltransferase [Deltaproteobacteria bacterium]